MITDCVEANTIRRCRSGVVPYTVIDEKIYLLFGVDSKYNELTDFGGGVKKNETIVSGGLRELREESCGIFSDIKLDDIQECITIIGNKMAIIFIPLDPGWYYDAEKIFTARVTRFHGLLRQSRIMGRFYNLPS